jgi:hypothetical protein
MKYKITMKAKAGDVYVGDGNEVSRSIVDGVDCQDNFVEYSDITGLDYGYMRFEFMNNELYTITEYVSNRELSESELSKLVEETQGQWSDGIGEGFEQMPCTYHNGEEVYVSPWYSGQEIEVKQELIK